MMPSKHLFSLFSTESIGALGSIFSTYLITYWREAISKIVISEFISLICFSMNPTYIPSIISLSSTKSSLTISSFSLNFRTSSAKVLNLSNGFPPESTSDRVYTMEQSGSSSLCRWLAPSSLERSSCLN